MTKEYYVEVRVFSDYEGIIEVEDDETPEGLKEWIKDAWNVWEEDFSCTGYSVEDPDIREYREVLCPFCHGAGCKNCHRGKVRVAVAIEEVDVNGE